MNTSIKAALISSLAACASIQGCKSEPPPAPPAAVAPEPPAFPEPPPLTGDPALCVQRQFVRDEASWKVTTYEYDATQRTVGRRMHFDTEGRITKWTSSDSFEAYTYDAQGNLHERARWKDEVLLEGTRWDNRYEGSPPRLVAQEVSDFRKPNERNAPHTRVSYEYGASGHVQEERKEGPRGMALRIFTWNAERIVAIHGSLGPRQPRSTMPFDEGVTYKYDAQHRLTAFEIDGEMPYGEGASTDGKPDQLGTLYYDVSGRLERMERDGWGGDVAPEAPDGKPDEVTLFSPPCDPIVKLAPQLFWLPELSLPHSLEPPLR